MDREEYLQELSECLKLLKAGTPELIDEESLLKLLRQLNTLECSDGLDAVLLIFRFLKDNPEIELPNLKLAVKEMFGSMDNAINRIIWIQNGMALDDIETKTKKESNWLD